MSALNPIQHYPRAFRVVCNILLVAVWAALCIVIIQAGGKNVAQILEAGQADAPASSPAAEHRRPADLLPSVHLLSY